MTLNGGCLASVRYVWPVIEVLFSLHISFALIIVPLWHIIVSLYQLQLEFLSTNELHDWCRKWTNSYGFAINSNQVFCSKNNDVLKFTFRYNLSDCRDRCLHIIISLINILPDSCRRKQEYTSVWRRHEGTDKIDV